MQALGSELQQQPPTIHDFVVDQGLVNVSTIEAPSQILPETLQPRGTNRIQAPVAGALSGQPTHNKLPVAPVASSQPGRQMQIRPSRWLVVAVLGISLAGQPGQALERTATVSQ